MPSKTIEDFAYQVKSYALGIKDQQVLGAWNFATNTGASSSSMYGIDFTKNVDDTITVNGTNDGTNSSTYVINASKPLKAGTYYLSGGVSANAGIQVYKSTSPYTNYGKSEGSEVTVTIPEDTNVTIIGYVTKNATVSNVVLKPMISLKPNQPYVPGAMTNRELSDKVIPIATDVKTDFNTWLANIDNQVSAQQSTLYRLGKLVVFMARLNVPLNHAFNASNVSMPSFLPVPMLSTYGFFQAAGIEANSMLTTTGRIYLIIPAKSSGNAFADVLYVYFIS